MPTAKQSQSLSDQLHPTIIILRRNPEMSTSEFIAELKKRKIFVMQEIEALDKIIFMHEGEPAKASKEKNETSVHLRKEDRAVIRHMILANKSDDEIAARFASVYPAIRTICKNQRYSRKDWDKVSNKPIDQLTN